VNRNSTWQYFGATDEQKARGFLLGLGDALVPASALRRVRLRYFDTFDWDLYRRGRVLVREGEVYRLLDRRTGAILAEQEAGGRAAPRFAWDFAQGTLQKELAPAIKVRALLQVVTLQGWARTFDYSAAGAGGTWRIEHRGLGLSRAGTEHPLLHLVGFRGAAGSSGGRKKLENLARGHGLRPVAPTLFEPALEIAGIRAAGYSSKIKVDLEPDQPASEAMALIAHRMLDVMKANLEGVRKDVDTEFLHDFRVAVRRTRSLLGMCKGILPRSARAAARKGFRSLGDLTGPLRDLDVFLLHFTDFRELLPEEFHAGLEDLYTLAAIRRRALRRELGEALTGNQITDILAGWEAFLDGDLAAGTSLPAKAARPVGSLANGLIGKRYARIVALAAGLGDDPRDADLHRVRIACKKLRYALEFFASLYPRKQVARLLATLKNLQDHLGEHNDLVMQLADLRDLLAVADGSRLSPRAAAAAGALVITLTERKVAVRARFTKVFAGFVGPKTSDLVERLIGKSG
jgi:CHAD domain-containing protein